MQTQTVKSITASASPGRTDRPPQSESGREASSASDQAAAVQAAAVNKPSFIFNRTFDFSTDPVTGRVLVSVKDRATGETIRQVPPAEWVHLSHVIRAQLGRLLDRML